jgi:hypothetical protein
MRCKCAAGMTTLGSSSLTTLAPVGAIATGASGRLRGQMRAVSELTADLRDAMWALFRPYYADVTRATFDADLAKKQHVALVFDTGDGRLRGFSTIELYQHTVDGRAATIVYSGDTIVDPRYWGQQTLQLTFYRFVVQLKLRRPWVAVYWFLLSKGYKTYLVLARACPEHWPRFDQPTPPRALELLDALATRKFGDQWKPELGIIRPATSDGRLREEVAPIGPEALRLPEVRFFAERNPGHRDADELVCLGVLDLRCFLLFAQRKLRRRFGRGGRGASRSSARLLGERGSR